MRSRARSALLVAVLATVLGSLTGTAGQALAGPTRAAAAPSGRWLHTPADADPTTPASYVGHPDHAATAGPGEGPPDATSTSAPEPTATSAPGSTPAPGSASSADPTPDSALASEVASPAITAPADLPPGLVDATDGVPARVVGEVRSAGVVRPPLDVPADDLGGRPENLAGQVMVATGHEAPGHSARITMTTRADDLTDPWTLIWSAAIVLALLLLTPELRAVARNARRR